MTPQQLRDRRRQRVRTLAHRAAAAKWREAVEAGDDWVTYLMLFVAPVALIVALAICLT